MSAARKGAAYGALTERERARLRAAYATVPAVHGSAMQKPARSYSGRGRRAWCRRCHEFSVVDDGAGGRCQRCGMQASGYEWVEAE
jgi:hypothetical protein